MTTPTALIALALLTIPQLIEAQDVDLVPPERLDPTQMVQADEGRRLESRDRQYGDVDLSFDYRLVDGEQAALYLAGAYRVPLAGWSQGGQSQETPLSSLVAAARSPGLWQHIHLIFRSARFDADRAGSDSVHAASGSVSASSGPGGAGSDQVGGASTSGSANSGSGSHSGDSGGAETGSGSGAVRAGGENGGLAESARLVSLEENEFPLEGNVALQPAADAPLPGDHASGPIVFRSDHVLQLRRIELRPVAAGAKASLKIAQVELIKGGAAGPSVSLAQLDWSKAKALGVKATFAQIPVHSAARFSGTLVVPAEQQYGLAAQANGLAQLYVDDQHVLGPVTLAAGAHSFQAIFVHRDEESPNLSVEIAGTRLPSQFFYLGGTRPKADPERHTGEPILKLATDRIVVQRAFVPFPNGERLEAISVGSPDQINYTYDLDRGTLLRAWRGRFLDMYNMWHERGEPQIAAPLGAVLTFDGEPLCGAPLEPVAYDLEPSGQPVFTSRFHGRTITDRIAPNASGGLTRTLSLSAGPEPITLSLARGGEMTALTSTRYSAADSSYFIDWRSPASEVRPAISGHGSSSALTVTLPASSASQEFSYDLSW